jgi:hypothetical protein
VDHSRNTTSGETLQDLCEQAGNETDSDKLQQLAGKIVQNLGDRRYQKSDRRGTEGLADGHVAQGEPVHCQMVGPRMHRLGSKL